MPQHWGHRHGAAASPGHAGCAGDHKLPTRALRQEGSGTACRCWIPSTMTVKLQPVQIATADGNGWWWLPACTPAMQVVAGACSRPEGHGLYQRKMAQASPGKMPPWQLLL